MALGDMHRGHSLTSLMLSPPKQMNLSLLTSQELKRTVSPLIKKMEDIDAAALLSLIPSSETNGPRLDFKGELTVHPIHDRITPSYAHDASNIVRYLHIEEAPNRYSAGIFVFPPNAEIPLHDHPNMVVLSRVLYGELKVKSYDVISPNKNKQEKSKEEEQTVVSKRSVFRSPLGAFRDFVLSSYHGEEHMESGTHDSSRRKIIANTNALHAKFAQTSMGVEQYQIGNEPVNILSAPHVTCLYPKEGNCHAFVAGPYGAAVLDILFPPYDDGDGRDCTFYEATEDMSASENRERKDQEFRLTPIKQPDHFHCLSGAYGRFTTCDAVCDSNEDQNRTLNIDVSMSSVS